MTRTYIVMIGTLALVPFATPAAAEDAAIARGMQAFTVQKCNVCHSIAGKGSKKGPLDEVGSKLSPAEIREWIVDPAAMTAKTKATRKPLMKKKAMSGEEVDSLVALLATLKKG
jgi:mono/diheme cytochrome c family protein